MRSDSNDRDPLPVAVWLTGVAIVLSIISIVIVATVAHENRKIDMEVRCMGFCLDVGRPVETVDPCTCEASHGAGLGGKVDI